MVSHSFVYSFKFCNSNIKNWKNATMNNQHKTWIFKEKTKVYGFVRFPKYLVPVLEEPRGNHQNTMDKDGS